MRFSGRSTWLRYGFFTLASMLVLFGLASPRPVDLGTVEPSRYSRAIAADKDEASKPKPAEAPSARPAPRTPMLWDTLKGAVSLTTEYLTKPPTDRDELKRMEDTIGKLNHIIIGNDAESESLIAHVVGAGFRNPDEFAFFQNLQTIRETLLADSTGKYLQFRRRVGFDKMMGKLGQNEKENPTRFKLFLELSAREGAIRDAWEKKIPDVTSAQQILDKRYGRMRFWGKVRAAGWTIPATALTGLLTSQLFPHLPLDLQATVAGIVGVSVAFPQINKIIGRSVDERARVSLADEYNRVHDGFKALLDIDPNRTVPFLIVNSLPREGSARNRPLEDLSLKLLKENPSPESTKALVAVGIFFIRNGDVPQAESVFDELARREPDGHYGKLWGEIKEVIQVSRQADKDFRAANRGSNLRKAALIGVPAAVAVWGTLQYLHGEELSTVVAIIRDMAIGEAALHGVGKFASALDSRPTKVARDQAEEKLLATFRRVPALGTPGMELLFALANNKIPSRTGTVIAQAATRAIEETEGFQSAHWVARLGAFGNRGSDPDEMARLAAVQLHHERRVIDQMCHLNFAVIGKPVRMAGKR